MDRKFLPVEKRDTLRNFYVGTALGVIFSLPALLFTLLAPRALLSRARAGGIRLGSGMMLFVSGIVCFFLLAKGYFGDVPSLTQLAPILCGGLFSPALLFFGLRDYAWCRQERASFLDVAVSAIAGVVYFILLLLVLLTIFWNPVFFAM